jgi:hypothetical protein
MTVSPRGPYSICKGHDLQASNTYGGAGTRCLLSAAIVSLPVFAGIVLVLRTSEHALS